MSIYKFLVDLTIYYMLLLGAILLALMVNTVLTVIELFLIKYNNTFLERIEIILTILFALAYVLVIFISVLFEISQCKTSVLLEHFH